MASSTPHSCTWPERRRDLCSFDWKLLWKLFRGQMSVPWKCSPRRGLHLHRLNAVSRRQSQEMTDSTRVGSSPHKDKDKDKITWAGSSPHRPQPPPLSPQPAQPIKDHWRELEIEEIIGDIIGDNWREWGNCLKTEISSKRTQDCQIRYFDLPSIWDSSLRAVAAAASPWNESEVYQRKAFFIVF